ncbi:MAG TPA: hypothetical protein VFA81_09680 [Burkholderiales bacterium]|nr:hypothetical protein [Burkholderiales bacterium]
MLAAAAVNQEESMKKALAVLVIAALVGPAASPAQDGEALFKSRCSACHTAKKATTSARKLPQAERSAYLDKFVSKHSPAPVDEPQRKAIVDYLLGVTD